VDLGGHKEACVTWDAHWQKLANAIKPFMFSCPAKWLNRSRCRLGCGIWWAQITMHLDAVQIAPCQRATLQEWTCPMTLCRELCKNGPTGWDALRIVNSGEPKEACISNCKLFILHPLVVDEGAFTKQISMFSGVQTPPHSDKNMRRKLVTPGEYQWTVCVQWQCSRFVKLLDHLLLLGVIAVLHGCSLLLQTEKSGLYVDRSVAIVSPAKMTELIEMPFGIWTPVRPRKHVLDGSHMCYGDAALCRITVTTCYCYY